MAKANILEWDTTANNNTDMNGIGIQGSNNVNNFDNAFRELMAQGAANLVTRFTSRAAGYTALKADHGQASLFTASATLSLTAAATLTNGWEYYVVASGGDVTIDPSGSETINGLTTITILNGQRAVIRCNGTAFYAFVSGEATIGPAIQGHLYGLTLSNNGSDATNDIDIAVGSAASDGTTAYLMTLASALTKRLDAAWAVGTGNGGLDTGAIADTTYHVWLIQRSDTGVVDALFSTSATSPTMPTNYDRKRRIGSIIRESAAIVAFRQTGDLFLRARASVRSNTAAFASALLAVKVPTGINVRPLLVNDLRITASSSDVSISMGSAAAGSADRIVQVISSGSAVSHIHEDVIETDKFTTDTSGQIYYAVTISTGSIALNALSCDGWIDQRGQ
ncbi:hypothetical protein HJB79_31405 [Rhizobium lentis]|uniref:hypothetical protein n=1 Tax=Rhizobium lentis TaxID=1138194 RepID=UPI001C83ED4D|nr:hypothetical protein [Rhizobium lentis]MBX5143217.1 hypothetical protein [Rhizobium lentis]